MMILCTIEQSAFGRSYGASEWLLVSTTINDVEKSSNSRQWLISSLAHWLRLMNAVTVMVRLLENCEQEIT